VAKPDKSNRLFATLTFLWPVLASRNFGDADMMKTCRSRSILCLVIGALFILGSAGPTQAAQEVLTGSIQEMMSPEEFKAAGLNKLSSEQLEKLNAWLQGYREATEKVTEKKTEKKVASQQSFFHHDPIVSRVDGSFAGLKGHTLVKLEDGTLWKQANLDDHAGPSPIDHPGAAVVWTGLGYKMRIQGVAEFYVNPVKTPK
jgi:hypothetical protein